MTRLSPWFHGIKGKLLVAAALPIVGFGIANIISSTGISKTNQLLTSSHKEIIPNMELLQEMRLDRDRFAYHIFNVAGEIESGISADQDLHGAKEAMSSFEKAYKDYAQASFMDQERIAYENVKGAFPEVVSVMNKVYNLAASNDIAKAKQAVETIKTEYANITAPVSKFSADALKLYRDRAEHEGALATTTQSQVATWTMTTIILANVFISGYLLWLASNMSNALAGIATDLNQAAGHVATSVQQLNSAGTGLSQSSTEAAASLEETVASLEELSSMVRMNSDNAKQAATLSLTSREAAEKGQQEMSTLISSMAKISQSSKKIEEIIHVIDDIAFQTNLLALNAAVEAARAGEQGKGFAVVAEAVRSLAQRSASAAKDITHLIRESVQQVSDGGHLAKHSGEVLDSIVTAVKKVSDLNNEISTASTEQTAGIQQISKAMNQLDQSAQSNASSAEKIADTGAEIDSLAQTSLRLTIALNSVIYGKAIPSTPPPTAPTAAQKTATASRGPINEPTQRETPMLPIPSRPTKPATLSEQAIPFDEDFGKIGTTDGF